MASWGEKSDNMISEKEKRKITGGKAIKWEQKQHK